MSTDETDSDAGTAVSVSDAPEPSTEAPAEKRRLEIAVEIRDAGPCKKHLKVSIPRTEIED
jgi:trigger factor